MEYFCKLFSVDLLGSFDPFTSTTVASDTNTATTEFEQIIDSSQTKLSNEDEVNSNPPPAPFIAFEDNLNKKTDNTSVPG